MNRIKVINHSPSSGFDISLVFGSTTVSINYLPHIRYAGLEVSTMRNRVSLYLFVPNKDKTPRNMFGVALSNTDKSIMLFRVIFGIETLHNAIWVSRH